MKDPLSQFTDSPDAHESKDDVSSDPLQQLPRRHFTLNRNIWLPIVIVIVLIVPLAWFGGKRLYDAFSFHRWASRNTNSLQQNLNTFIDDGKVDFSDPNALAAYANMHDASVNDVKYYVQYLRIFYLGMALLDYRTLHGGFPDSPNVLERSYDATIAACTTQRVTCQLSKLATPLEDISSTDIYTNDTFPYTLTNNDFTLTYTMGSCGNDHCKDLTDLFVQGTNTMTSTDLSIEKPGISGKIFPNTNTDTNANKNANLNVNSGTNTNDATSDRDGDGLTDSAEINVFHTDPNKKDTDGDGYDDNIEVHGGFNPNGTGTLTYSGGEWSSCVNLEAGTSCTVYCSLVGKTCINKGTAENLQNAPAEFQNSSGRETWGSELTCQNQDRSKGGMSSGGCDDMFAYPQQGVRCFCI